MRERKRREIELAERLVLPDGADFEECFEKFAQSIGPRLFQYSLIVCGQREDAEEIAQETLFAAYRDFRRLRDPDRVHPWFFRIARNSCLMRRRSESTRRECGLAAAAQRPPEAIVLETESVTRLARAIAELPEDFRMVVTLRCIEGLTTEETAYALGVSEDLVRTRLHRARTALRRSINRD